MHFELIIRDDHSRTDRFFPLIPGMWLRESRVSV